ncbi:MAG: CRISPR-associated protein Cas5 [Thaumarchaeota archaeon]|nr:CRISPR-associated protein Cas5 [Candidatus Geocrenenecus arthurdayi]
MKAFTFKVRFLTAQFKDHTAKLTRRTYLIPPPSAIAGFFGAVLGLRREELAKLSKEILAGAELRSLGGRIFTLTRIFKIDRSVSRLSELVREYYKDRKSWENSWKEVQELRPIYESEELYLPEYKFAIASSNESLIEEGVRRLREHEFEYDVFGGNDYHFVDFVDEPRPARIYKSREGYGYCPREDFERIETNKIVSNKIVFSVDAIRSSKNPIIMPATFLAKVNTEFIQVYGTKIIAKKELNVVDDDESRIFVYEVDPFLTMRI